ncbi:MAG: choice-of-anchor Q domain-containing protein [Verrucomicrobiota bacterium]
MKSCFLKIIILLVLPTNHLFALVRYVDANGTNPDSPYTNWVTAATNIQDAINVAEAGDMVLVTNGVYQYGSFPELGSNRVYIAKSLTVQSVNGPAVTLILGDQLPGTINGTNAVRCVYMSAGVLSGFTLTNGATPNIDGFGGGVYCSSYECVVSNCLITGNSAYLDGGGVNSGEVINCILSGNEVGDFQSDGGGGAHGSLLINCLLTRNYSASTAGAAEQCTLINCTVVSNSAAGNVGAVETSTLKNTIVYYNYSHYTNADVASGDECSNCCASFLNDVGIGIFTNAPLFVNPAAGNYHLLPWSPCINAGNNSFITNINVGNNPLITDRTDLDGKPRIVGGIVDIGAYEFQSSPHFVSLAGTNPVAPFTNWLTAATNIQDAIDAANTGDLIVVSNGTYQSGATLVDEYTLPNRIVIDKAVTVQSVNGATATIIAGSRAVQQSDSTSIRCAYLANGSVLSGFTLTNGATQSSGDTSNDESGGGVWCESASAMVTNCVLMGNSAFAYGGAAYQGTFDNCLIISNSANTGGGLYGCVANHSLFSSNVAIDGSGGGAYSNFLNNCILLYNRAISMGGGAYRSTLINCTVVSNTASAIGGGVAGGSATNCVVFDNSSPDATPSNWSAELMSYCDTKPLPESGFDNLTNDPAFVDPAAGNFQLQSNSPCINSGENLVVTSSTDFSGNPRIVGGTVDMGAYEYQTPTSLVGYAWLQQYGLPSNGSVDAVDLDGTGFDVYQDWIAGLNPTNPASVLAVLPPVPVNNANDGVTVTWQSVPGINYFIQRGSDLAAQPAFTTIQSNVVGQAGSTSYTDTNAVGTGPYFYRVGVP